MLERRFARVGGADEHQVFFRITILRGGDRRDAVHVHGEADHLDVARNAAKHILRRQTGAERADTGQAVRHHADALGIELIERIVDGEVAEDAGLQQVAGEGVFGQERADGGVLIGVELGFYLFEFGFRLFELRFGFVEQIRVDAAAVDADGQIFADDHIR